jgi:hypothetical protein
MEHLVSLLLTPHPLLPLAAIGAGGLAVLLFLLGRGRRAGWRARVIGPGVSGNVVYRATDAADLRAPSFLVELEDGSGPREVLPRGASLISPWLGPHRGELRVDDPVLVEAVVVEVPRGEQLYRQAGCQLALDALALVRLTPTRSAGLRGAAVLCLGLSILAAGGAILPGAVERASDAGYLPASILQAGRSFTAAGLTCPAGSRLETTLRDSRFPGFVHRCRRDGVDHGPFVERDLTGLLRRSGWHRDGRRTGTWVEQLPPELEILIRIQTFSDGRLDGPFSELTRRGEARTGSYRAGERSGWWEQRRGSGLLHAGTYVRGVKDGWWWESGSFGTYRQGKRQGEWELTEQVLPDLGLLGGATTTCRLVDGQKQGRARVYFADGRLGEGELRDDLPDGTWSFSSASGRELAFGEYRRGRRVGEWAAVDAGARYLHRVDRRQKPAFAIGQNGSPP